MDWVIHSDDVEPPKTFSNRQPWTLDMDYADSLENGSRKAIKSAGQPSNIAERRSQGDSFKELLKETFPNIQHVSYAYGAKDRSRVLGTLAVASYVGIWVAGALIFPVIIILLAFRQWIAAGVLTGLVIICYIVPVRQSESFRRATQPWFARYFKESSVSFEHVPDTFDDRPTLLCISPHGAFCMGWALAFLTAELSHFQFCFSSFLRLNPFLRILTSLLGHPNDISRATVMRLMRQGQNITLIPGAWHEATIHHWKKDRVWLRERKGFIKFALRYGYTITPSFCFGERETYRNPQGCFSCRFWLNDRKIITILPFGRWFCPMMPRPAKLDFVIGTPIELPQIAVPSLDDINKWHAVYIERLKALYSKYNSFFYDFDPDDSDDTFPMLEVW